MECPHLKDCVRSVDIAREGPQWQCSACKTPQSPWICMSCGEINCGRYVNGHAKAHWEQEGSNHCVCMDCESLSVYCYICDEFVANDMDMSQVQKAREVLQALHQQQAEREGAVVTNGDTDSSAKGHKEHQVWEGSNGIAKAVQDSTRNLRPRMRKRTSSEDSFEIENRQGKRKRGENSKHNMQPREKRVIGLRNLGNTCFMNAVLQSLSNIQEFCCYFKQLPSLEQIKSTNGKRMYSSRSLKDMSDAVMAEELRKILIGLNQGGTKGAISPESLFNVIWKVVPRFRGYQQQDAHEFLRYMLDRLHTELLHLLPDLTSKDSPYISLGHRGKSSIVTSVFGGTLQNEVHCLHCGQESKKHDPFLDLSLDIPDKFVGGNAGNKKGKEEDSVAACTLSDCLTSFIEIEELAETELYYCSNCKSKQRSTKRFWIRRLPNVLCLHLKRFRWNNYFRTKVDARIQFPLTALDMSKYILSNLHETRRSGTGTNLYDLAAVIVHHGSGAASGHYTAYAINDGQWFNFNDSTVKPTDSSAVAKCKAYILFYIRREFRLPQLSS